MHISQENSGLLFTCLKSWDARSRNAFFLSCFISGLEESELYGHEMKVTSPVGEDEGAYVQM